jgi:hypothetical protein
MRQTALQIKTFAYTPRKKSNFTYTELVHTLLQKITAINSGFFEKIIPQVNFCTKMKHHRAVRSSESVAAILADTILKKRN